MGKNKLFIILGIMFILMAFAKAQTANWELEVVPEEKPFWEIYLQRMLSFFPGTVVSWASNLVPGGKVVGNAWYKPCRTKYGNQYLLATWAQITLYSPYGETLATKSTKLSFRNPTTWNEYCQSIPSSLVSGFTYQVLIPKNASPGRYKVCVKFFFRSEDVGNKLNLPSLLYGLGQDCDEFYIKSEKPTPEPTPKPTPKPGPNPPTCTPGFIGDRWCSGGRVMQMYRFQDCSTKPKVVEDCAAQGMICKAGACQVLECKKGYIRIECKGNKVYGVKYVKQGNECVEQEELLDDCSALEGGYCENGTCKVEPNCSSFETKVGEWVATGECDDEGEIFRREITYYKYDKDKGKCVPVTKAETKVEPSPACAGGVPVIFILFIGGALISVVVILYKMRGRR